MAVTVSTAPEGRPSIAVPRWFAESAGAVLALAFALLAVWHLDATDQSWRLYYDPDSVLPALVRGSVLAGQPQDWSLSAVLFIPEMGLYFAVAALGLGVKATFAFNAVVNFLLLYASLRLVSGLAQRAAPRSHRISGALVAFGAMMSLTLLEDAPRPDTFEFASLLATTTFYSMTVLASVSATGIVARLVAAGRGRRRRWLESALVGLSALSALTNPLFLAWAAIPLVLVLALVGRRRLVSWRHLIRAGALLGVGSGLGLAGRIPFAHVFSQYGPVYADPGRAGLSAIYYPAALAERTSTVAGAVSLTLVVALILVSGLVFGRSLSARDAAAAVVSGMGWVAPVAVIAGAICLGTMATRYLQPMFFAPVCTLVFAPRLFAPRMTFLRPFSGTSIQTLSAAIVVCLGVSAVATGALSRSAAVVDPDIRCVDEWISSQHGTGAGRFWTIRGPKAYLSEPDRLIQVDSVFGAYQWLTNRADYSTRKVSFVVSDAPYGPPALPPVASAAPHRTVSCGRYTITDFGADILPIGPAASTPLA